MITEGKIGVREAIWLVTLAISAKMFFASPSMLVDLAGNTGWYMTLISAVTALAGFMFIYLLLKRFPGRDIMEIFDITLGRVLGFAFSGILAIYLLFKAVTRIAEFNEVIKVYVFPLSPNWLITGIYVICVFTLCILGLESIARFTKLLIYFMLAGFLAVLILSSQNYNPNYLYPILGYGLDKTLLHGVVRSSVYGEVILLAVFAQSLQGLKHIKKEGVIGILLSAVLISLSLLSYTLTFPYYTARDITAPMYEMATFIDYGRFLQRVEPIFLFVWITSTLISTAIVIYSFIWIYCRIFRMQDKKPICIAGCILLYAAVLMHKDIETVLDYVQWLRNYGAIFVFILPLVSLATAFIRKKGAKAHA